MYIRYNNYVWYNHGRFMICCDSCGEWYHGDCVGISVAEGKRMEKTGQEYVCTKCVGKKFLFLLLKF